MVDSDLTLQTVTTIIAGSAGVAIVSTELFGGVPALGTVGSTIAVTVLAAPLLHACYRITATSSAPAVTRANDVEKMDGEVVKQRTELWSEEARINPAFPLEQGADRQPATAEQNASSPPFNAEYSGTEHENCETNQRTLSVNTSDLEFNWQSETDVSFDDVGGMHDLKDELQAEIIKPLENPQKAEKLGVAAPNIVFHGPPGTGKTFMAKALATELQLPFVALSGADIQSKWINESASKVNNLFSEAREIAAQEDGAVVFIDELDSVLKSRSGNGNSHEEDNKVVNEFLNHLEETGDHNVVFVGATNRLDALDDAGIRSGRIDLKIHIGKPDAAAREAILHAQLADREHEISDESIAELAAATDGTVAADLERIVNEAAKHTLSRGGDTIYRSDID